MSRRRPEYKTLLNLDSLTDTVTNLAGALVLLVVLVLGLTRSGLLRPSAAGGRGQSNRTIEALVERVDRLRLEVRLMEREIRTIEENLPKLRERVKELTEGVDRRADTAILWPKAFFTVAWGNTPGTPQTHRNRLAEGHNHLDALANLDWVGMGEFGRWPNGMRNFVLPPGVLPQASVTAGLWPKKTRNRTRYGFQNDTPHHPVVFTHPPSNLPASLAVIGHVDATLTVLLASSALGGLPGEAPSQDDLQVQIIREAIQESESMIADLETRASRAIDELEQLLAKVQTFTPEEKAQDQPPEAPQADEVLFRPPLEQFADKAPLMLYCRDGTVSVLDCRVLNKRIAELLLQRGKKTAKEKFEFDLPDSDLRCVVILEGRIGRDLKLQRTVVRRPGHRGESAEEIQSPDSRFKRALALHPQQAWFAYFGVWPDSFELFRQAREIAWKAGYQVGWVPIAPGQEMSIGEGRAMTE